MKLSKTRYDYVIAVHDRHEDVWYQLAKDRGTADDKTVDEVVGFMKRLVEKG